NSGTASPIAAMSIAGERTLIGLFHHDCGEKTSGPRTLRPRNPCIATSGGWREEHRPDRDATGLRHPAPEREEEVMNQTRVAKVDGSSRNRWRKAVLATAGAEGRDRTVADVAKRLLVECERARGGVASIPVGEKSTAVDRIVVDWPDRG